MVSRYLLYSGQICVFSPPNSLKLACAESYEFLGIAPPPPNLLLNPDILQTFNAFALEKSIKQVNMKLVKRFIVLTSL